MQALVFLALTFGAEPVDTSLMSLQDRSDLARVRMELTSQERAIIDELRKRDPYYHTILARRAEHRLQTLDRRALRAQLTFMRHHPHLFVGQQGCQASRGDQHLAQLRRYHQARTEGSISNP